MGAKSKQEAERRRWPTAELQAISDHMARQAQEAALPQALQLQQMQRDSDRSCRCCAAYWRAITICLLIQSYRVITGQMRE